MKNMPSTRFHALLAMLLLFAPSSFVLADWSDEEQSDVTRSCSSGNACVDQLTVCGDAKIRGNLTVCGKLFPEVAGPRGPRGKQGRRGRQGPAGQGGAIDYAYIYNTTEQLNVPVESDVIFGNNGPISAGITHIPGTAQVRIVNSGVYYVMFSITALLSNQFALAINGFAAPETVYGVQTTLEFSDIQQNQGVALLFLSAGDVLTVRNHSSVGPVTLPIFVGGSQPNVNASITIMRLS